MSNEGANVESRNSNARKRPAQSSPSSPSPSDPLDNTNTNPEQVSQLLQKVDEILVMNENRYFTNEVTEVIKTAQTIIEERMQAEMNKRIKKIKMEVRKKADVRWRAFISDIKKEGCKTKRKIKHLQRRMDRIEMRIEMEEQNVRLIPARLKRFEASLKKQLKKMRRMQKREMKKERKRMERKEREKEIWIREEMQRRLSEARQKSLFSSHNTLSLLTFYLLGLGSGFAPSLLAFIFPAAPAVETGFFNTFLSNLLDSGAAESGSFLGKVAEVAVKAVSGKLASKTNCCIQ